MSRVVPLVRAVVLAHAQRALLQSALLRLSASASAHVPLGGAAAIGQIFELLGWRETLSLAQCCRALQAAVCAKFGDRRSPVLIRADQLAALGRSRVARTVRALEVDCGDGQSDSGGGSVSGSVSGGSSRGGRPALGSSSAGRPLSPVGLSEEGVSALRALPLLRSLSLLHWGDADPLRLVQLLARPAPELLQRLTLQGAAGLNVHFVHALRCLPALHTLELRECTLNDDCHVFGAAGWSGRALPSSSASAAGSDSASAFAATDPADPDSALSDGDGVLEPLALLPNLTALSLDADPGRGFSGQSLAALGLVPLLRHLHLRALLCGPGVLRGLCPALFGGANVRTQLRTLALGFAELAPWPPRRLRTAAAAALRRRSAQSLRALRGLCALVAIELSFARPLPALLSHVAALPRLERILIGDDDLAALEEEAEGGPGCADPAAAATTFSEFASASSSSSRSGAGSGSGDPTVADADDEDVELFAPGGLFLCLQRAPSLHTIALWGFAGVSDRPQRMGALAERAARSRVNGVPDDFSGLMPPPRRRTLVDLGERHEQAIRRMPEFGFDPIPP